MGGGNMGIVQMLMERLRPLVGSKGWDYSVLWKLSDDQRFIEWMDCCCGGSERYNENGGGEEELHFPAASPVVLPCRDVWIQHPRTKSCDFLSQLPSSIPLDSGVYSQTLVSNQHRWLTFSNNPDSDVLEETGFWTRVLVPIMGGLIEFFVAKQVAEDQNIIDYITTQCNIPMEQEGMINNNINSYSINNLHDHQEINDPTVDHNINHHFQPSVSPTSSSLPYEISLDRIRLCNGGGSSSTAAASDHSPMNLLQQFNYNTATDDKPQENDVVFGGSEYNNNGLLHHHHDHDMDAPHHHQNLHMPFMEGFDQQQQHNHEDHMQQGMDDRDESTRQDINDRRLRSNSDSELVDEDEDIRNIRYTRKGNQSKNLVAERKRRKKLNDRLYTLRSLVPNISKLDRAAILGDAVEFVKELQKQAKELQDELENDSDNEGNEGGASKNMISNNGSIINGSLQNNNSNVQSSSELPNQQIINGVNDHHHKSPKDFDDHEVGGLVGDNNGNVVPKCINNIQESSETSVDKSQQMEAQVEVAHLDGNEYFIRVFCEHKAGGFMRLMEALHSLGMEVTNASLTSCTGLVSNVLKVKKRDSEIVQADHVRDSIIELTRNPSRRGWSSENNKGMEYHDHHHHPHSHYNNSNHHLHHHLPNN